MEPGLGLRSGPRTTHSCATQSATDLCYDAEVVVHVPHLTDDLTITIQVLQKHSSSNIEIGGRVRLTTSTLYAGTNTVRKQCARNYDGGAVVMSKGAITDGRDGCMHMDMYPLMTQAS
jgi:hypothetical protein